MKVAFEVTFKEMTTIVYIMSLLMHLFRARDTVLISEASASQAVIHGLSVVCGNMVGNLQKILSDSLL